MSTLGIVIVCLTAVSVASIWNRTRIHQDETDIKRFEHYERMAKIVADGNANAVKALHEVVGTGKHESWCGAMDGRPCNCKG